MITKEVSSLIRRVAETEILPRFRQLAIDDVHEKSEGELVTAADIAAEAALFAGLTRILPEAGLVGEEASEADPRLLEAAREPGFAWMVDPIDGTAHFARGEGPFGTIVALLKNGQTEASWIYLPLEEKMATAQRGKGAFLNGEQPKRATSAPVLRGALLTRFLPPTLRERVESSVDGLDLVAEQRCAAKRYVELLAGTESFALYYRTLPWDHAAGALLVQEAGAVVRRFDGREYSPLDESSGLLVAASDELWSDLHKKLLADCDTESASKS